MSRAAKQVKAPPMPAPTKGAFDPKRYANSFVSEEEVTNIKTSFDLFDTDQGGTIDIKGTNHSTQNLKPQ